MQFMFKPEKPNEAEITSAPGFMQSSLTLKPDWQDHLSGSINDLTVTCDARGVISAAQSSDVCFVFASTLHTTLPDTEKDAAARADFLNLARKCGISVFERQIRIQDVWAASDICLIDRAGEITLQNYSGDFTLVKRLGRAIERCQKERARLYSNLIEHSDSPTKSWAIN